jgi:hypothetical protein
MQIKFSEVFLGFWINRSEKKLHINKRENSKIDLEGKYIKEETRGP